MVCGGCLSCCGFGVDMSRRGCRYEWKLGTAHMHGEKAIQHAYLGESH